MANLQPQEKTIKGNISSVDNVINANLVDNDNTIKSTLVLTKSATTERKGIIRIATDSEALEGTDKTIAITPHTLKQFVDTNALAIDTPYGYNIEMLLDEETYLLTIILKDKNGGVLSSTTADFPIESIIDSGRYDNTTKTIIFELKNGETIEIPIGDLIDGLQAEITIDNKLNSDLVDDSNAVNKFVTAENKTTWNGKQNAIPDLSTIRSNAEVGKNASDTISGYGDVVTHDADEFMPADTVIPVVNDAKLTIQKNGTAVDTFTANASTDKIINITVPTKASDVSALPSSTKYGASLSMSINSTTYVLTAQMKDQDGNNLGVAQKVDLPIESLVMDVDFDEDTNELIIKLQNGSTTRVPIGSIIGGLQSEINADNKLDADFIEDTLTTKKLVTTAEKNTWNSKQDAISDLTTIRSNASNGNSAYTTIQGYGDIVTHDADEFLTEHQDLSGYQTKITSSNKLSADLLSEGTTNKLVSATEKSTWNGKQNAITSSNKLSADLLSEGTTNKLVSASEKTTWNDKQDALVSGTNIKTINGNSLLGSGNITIEAGSDITVDQTYSATSANAQSGVAINGANFIVNNAAGSANGVAIKGSGSVQSTQIGALGSAVSMSTSVGFSAYATGSQSITIGHRAQASASKSYAFGEQAKSTAIGAFQFGQATNSEAGSVYFGLTTDGSTTTNYKLLGSDGKIPDDRLNTTIALTSAIPTESTVSGWGFTKNTGTVTKVNNVQPVNGNVTLPIPSATSELTNDSGYITGISSSDVTTALGYTPYNATNPNGYTSNVGTVTSVNNIEPVNGNVTITIPDSATWGNITGTLSNQTDLQNALNGKTLVTFRDWSVT